MIPTHIIQWVNEGQDATKSNGPHTEYFFSAAAAAQRFAEIEGNKAVLRMFLPRDLVFWEAIQ